MSKQKKPGRIGQQKTSLPQDLEFKRLKAENARLKVETARFKAEALALEAKIEESDKRLYAEAGLTPRAGDPPPEFLTSYEPYPHEIFFRLTGHDHPDIGDLLSSQFRGEHTVSIHKIAWSTGQTVEQVIDGLRDQEAKGFVSIEWYVKEKPHDE